MSKCLIPPYTILLYSKTGVYRDIHNFLIYALKHILVLTCTHNICFEQNYENSQNNSTEKTENRLFFSREKSLFIAWACFRND